MASAPWAAWMDRKRRRHLRKRGVPVDRAPAAVLAPEERRGRAVAGVEDGQGFPALRAGHAEVDRVFGRRRQVYRLAIAEVDGQAATGRTETADHPRGRVRRLAGGDLPQAEPARGPFELARQAAVADADERQGAVEQRRAAVGDLHGISPPGIFGLTTAVKKRYRSAISPAIETASARTAAAAAAPGFAVADAMTAAAGRTTPPTTPRRRRNPAGRWRGPTRSMAVFRNAATFRPGEAAGEPRLEPEFGGRGGDQAHGDHRERPR